MIWNVLLAASTNALTTCLLLRGVIVWTEMTGPLGSEAAPGRLRACCLGIVLAGLLLSAGYTVPVHAWAGYTEPWQFALVGAWTGLLVAFVGYLALLDVSLRLETAPCKTGLWLTLILLGPWGPFYYAARIIYLATRPITWHPPATIPPPNEPTHSG